MNDFKCFEIIPKRSERGITLSWFYGVPSDAIYQQHSRHKNGRKKRVLKNTHISIYLIPHLPIVNNRFDTLHCLFIGIRINKSSK